MTTEAAVETATETPAATPAAPVDSAPSPAVAEPAPVAEAIDYSRLAAGENVSASTFSALHDLAKQHNVPLDAAQGFLDAVAAENTARDKAQTDNFATIKQQWHAELLADPKVGEQGLAHAKTFIDTYGGAELLEELKSVGLDSFPALIRALAKAGKDAGESPIVPSNGAVNAGPWYDRFYSSVKPTLRN